PPHGAAEAEGSYREEAGRWPREGRRGSQAGQEEGRRAQGQVTHTKETAPTALMRQYLDVKSRYPDALVLFRLGDFYELFYEDAVYAARVLDLTLTTRDKGKEDPVPMCGVPHHAVRAYLAKLTELGHRVALCEQLEDPKVARGIVKRDVVRVITPGVVLDEESLDPRSPSYVAAAV